MSQYPSEEKRAQIVAQRNQLMQELIRLMVIDNQRQRNKETERLVRQYGQDEVKYMASILENRFQRDLDNEELFFYQEYVEQYRRFGGQRPFLSMAEYTEASSEFSMLFARKEIDRPLSDIEEQRRDELNDLLFKDAFLWQDLAPENPPGVMPEVELPTPQPRPRQTAQGAPAGKHRCERDGFPMLKIHGQLECVAEYIDRCIGQQPIVDVIRDGKIAYYVFENGHALPLLCSCCDGPLDMDIEWERRDKVGRRLESMALDDEIYDGQEIEELILQFSKKGWRSQEIGIPVSFNVAARMRHPAHCPHRTRLALAKSPSSRSKKRKRKRRYRKLPGRN